MKKRILTEMAIYDEDEVFSLQPVADVTTTGLEQLEGPDFINHIVKAIDTSNLPEDYVLTNRELNEIYSHHCAYRILKKAAFLALPQILQAKLVLSSWKKKTVQDGSKSNDNRVSGLMGAPITIDNVKYLCLVGMRKNRNKIITPYTITLKDANGVIVGDKKVNSDIIVPDSNNGTSAFGSTHLSTDTASLDANSPSNANIDKNNKTEKNESKNMTKKNTIRLTESELKKVITESVKNILNEGINGWNPNYKNKDGIMYDDFAEAFLRTISKTYQSPFQASQVVFEMVTQAAQICGCDYGRLMEQIKRDYENIEFYN